MNKLDLTVYMIKGDNEKISDLERLKKSFLINKPEVFKHIQDRQLLPYMIPKTKWYMYLFDNEWLDENIAKVLNIWLYHEEFDYFVMWKKVRDREGILRTYVVPRIFKSNIKIDDKFLPIGRLQVEKILDGWILETPRV